MNTYFWNVYQYLASISANVVYTCLIYSIFDFHRILEKEGADLSKHMNSALTS